MCYEKGVRLFVCRVKSVCWHCAGGSPVAWLAFREGYMPMMRVLVLPVSAFLTLHKILGGDMGLSKFPYRFFSRFLNTPPSVNPPWSQHFS